MLLASVKADYALPEEFFVPDLWSTAIKLPKGGEREAMLDVWHLGHDLARAVGYDGDSTEDYVRNDVGGTVFTIPRIEPRS